MKRLVLLCVALLIPLTASATRIPRLTLEEVREKAGSIFSGRVVSSAPRAIMDGKLSVTDYTIEVAEVFHGQVGSHATVTCLGSAKAVVIGAPKLEMGRTYVFFRNRQPNFTTVGWGQGLFTIETAKVGETSRTVLVSGDGEALTVVNGRLSRGPAVEVRDNRLVVASAEQTEPSQGGIALNADGTPARRLRAPVSAGQPESPSYATLDDLRTFVRSKVPQPDAR